MRAYERLATVYDGFTRDVDYAAFADFYERLFRRYGVKPQLVLDLACGTGSLTIELARRGYETIGVDASEEMLSEANDKALDAGLTARPLLLCQRAQELDLYGTVTAAVSSLDAFNYLSEAELRETLRRLRLFIEPGGLLIFDVYTPERLRSLDGQAFIDEDDGAMCVWRASFDEASAKCVYGVDLFTLEDGGLWRRSQEEHTEYAHTEELLRRLLTEAGFVSIEVFAELREAPPTDSDGRIFFAAVRGEG